VGFLAAFGHVAGLFLPALALGALAAALVKLVWRRELAALRWRDLALSAAAAGAAVTLGGLVLFGRDGRMATYGAMVAACAVTLWWRAFVARR
jgi:H+/Cl- antiporter ClcA